MKPRKNNKSAIKALNISAGAAFIFSGLLLFSFPNSFAEPLSASFKARNNKTQAYSRNPNSLRRFHNPSAFKKEEFSHVLLINLETGNLKCIESLREKPFLLPPFGKAAKPSQAAKSPANRPCSREELERLAKNAPRFRRIKSARPAISPAPLIAGGAASTISCGGFFVYGQDLMREGKFFNSSFFQGAGGSIFAGAQAEAWGLKRNQEAAARFQSERLELENKVKTIESRIQNDKTKLEQINQAEKRSQTQAAAAQERDRLDKAIKKKIEERNSLQAGAKKAEAFQETKKINQEIKKLRQDREAAAAEARKSSNIQIESGSKKPDIQNLINRRENAKKKARQALEELRQARRASQMRRLGKAPLWGGSTAALCGLAGAAVVYFDIGGAGKTAENPKPEEGGQNLKAGEPEKPSSSEAEELKNQGLKTEEDLEKQQPKAEDFIGE